ncbi:hypothetical protein Oweho_3427 [Owenweeksia hongkongensis DSM 17368]|uniref:Tyr recombinase domain-containing protein n=1 Tax=Owenweeksia hongkongensis (strain DSM 17368 / CIP 108786 / JCM 12287 / NRRL B-23963 / UST20020801) TaxID=926562 RepID=G8R5R0_OWEHD|nr:phage integrase SAM-like domain-containing protein [Owenweeksia hongkongensis]AEV34376.1 hypothetical protein Oweho_3427 [Owenweeksia hongkongensis DSM 17368]
MVTSKVVRFHKNQDETGRYPLKTRVTYKGNHRYVDLGRKVHKEFWNQKTGRPLDNCPDETLFDFVSEEAKKQLKIRNYLNTHPDKLSFDQIIDVFKNGINGVVAKSKTSFVQFYDIIIKELQAQKKSYSLYITVQNCIRKYGDVALKDIDYEWVLEFRLTMGKHMGNNGLHAYMRNMRTTYKHAQLRKGYDLLRGYNPFEKNMPSKVATPTHALSRKDIEKLEEANLRPYVKIWLLMFYFAGMDLIDLALLKWTDIKEGRIKFRRAKLAGRSGYVVNIRIFPKAQAIIDELGDKTSDRVFSVIPHPEKQEKKYSSFRANLLQRYLQPLTREKPARDHYLHKNWLKPFERLELSDELYLKGSRATFKSIGRVELRLDIEVIKVLMGHQLNNVDHTYQTPFTDDILDEVHAKIIGEA